MLIAARLVSVAVQLTSTLLEQNKSVSLNYVAMQGYKRNLLA